MVTWLARHFIKDWDEYGSMRVRQAYGALCGCVGILFNVLLFLGKFLAGTLSNSIAITADAFNNLSDAGSSVIVLLGFRIAGQKPDSEHPFGHGRIEYLSGLMVAVAIILMAFELIRSSFDKILHPSAIDFSWLFVGILAVSIAVKGYMFFYNWRIGQKLASAAMKATATDSISDMGATTVVLAATLLAHFTGVQIDGYCGILVGGFILAAGISAAKETVDPLLGQPADPALVHQIEEIVMEPEQIQGYHDLIVHNYGPGRLMISLHAEVSADGNLLQLHDVIDLVERRLSEQLGCSAVIHMDPICTGDEQTNHARALIREKLAQIDPALTFHDFRMVKGPTHVNYIFDIVIPYECRLKEQEILEQLTQKVRSQQPESYLVVQFDRTF